MNFDTFKHELSNLNSYRKSLKKIEEEMEDIIYQFAGVKGIRYDREPSMRNIRLAESVKLKMTEALKEPQREYDFTLMMIQRIERNLSLLPQDTRDMCVMHYVDRMPLVYVGDAYGYTPSGAIRKMQREVEKI